MEITIQQPSFTFLCRERHQYAESWFHVVSATYAHVFYSFLRPRAEEDFLQAFERQQKAFSCLLFCINRNLSN